MDSFFAAADNLDNLLDELEESEGVQQVPLKQKQLILQEEVSSEEVNLPGSIQKNLEYPHQSQSETNDLSVEKLCEPVFSSEKESNIQSVDNTLTDASNHVTNAAADTQQLSTENGGISLLEKNPNGLIIQNGNARVTPQSPIIDSVDLDSPKPPNHVQSLPKTGLPTVMPQVLENSYDHNPSQSNAELLMDLFGPVPISKTESSADPTISLESCTVFSPLNPFNDAYNQTDLESQLPDSPGNLLNAENFKPKSFLSQSNPFYNVDSNFQSSDATSGTENGGTNTEINASSSQPALASNTVLPVSGIVQNLEAISDDSDQRLSVVYASLDNQHSTISYSSEDYEPPVDKQSSDVDSSIEPCSPPAFLKNDIAANPPSQKPVERLSVDTKDVASEVLDSESFSTPAFLQNTDVASPPPPEKQERSSVGFMKDVAVSQEEFDKFWEEMEKAEEDSFDSSTANDRQNQSSDISQMPPTVENPVPAHTQSKSEVITEGNWAVAVVEAPTSTDDDAVIISSIPADTLVSESEFEQFLASEMVGNAPEVNVTPPTASHTAMESSPVSIPVVSVPETHDGSPTFPLNSRSQGATQVSSESHQDDQQPESNSRLSLIISAEAGSDTEGTEPDPRYPATPPPPYTEEMHANYERSLSPTQQTDPHNRQVPDSANRRANEGECVEDDLSVLPSAILDSITRPGDTKPVWVSDQDAPQCSNCAMKFTFMRRRHHCRACGRVFCAACCGERASLKYMEYKETRVCSMCSLAIKQADALAEIAQQRAAQNRSRDVASTPRQVLESRVETRVDVVVPPPEDAPQPAVEAVEDRQTPATGVSTSHAQQPSNQEGSSTNQVTSEDMEVEGAMAQMPSSKSVRFSDGTRPTHPDGVPTTPPPPSRVNRVRKKHSQPKDPSSPEAPELPPVIIAHGENGAFAVQENPDPGVVISLLESGEQNPQSFVLNPNLIVHIKFVTYAGHRCWCYWSEGMDVVGQREVVLLFVQEGDGDRQISKDAFSFYSCIFDRARKGKIFNTTDFMPRTMLGIEDSEEIFGLTQNSGFLFVQATSQALDGLSCLKKKVMQFADGYGNTENSNLPIKSMLFALLVQKNEAPWATLFPMRLMLRFGVETKQYPCPLFSIRRRAPVYHELGHTILAILCDFRNFKYRVVSVPGLKVFVTSSGNVHVHIPCNRFTDTIRIMNSSNESVLAMGTGTFGPKILPQEDSDGPCDSHLVCVQDQENSVYHTEIMSMKGTNAINTGAAFVIFNGSLKSDGTHAAKCVIVEDGIMIQLLPEKMEELRASLKSMEDFKVDLSPNATDSMEAPASTAQAPNVEVKWVDDDIAFNIGMFSPIDGTPFEGVVGFNVQGRSEQRGRKHTLRWNQVFFLASTSNPIDMSRLAEQVANGCFLALTPVLHELAKHRQHKIAVRVTIHPENVGYVAGSGLHDLPQPCMNALDDQLIQTIHNAANSVAVEQEAVIIELLFSILLPRPAYRTA